MDKHVEVFKALADKNRLMIIDMLSCGELCACDITGGLDLTQPTVSHHMKILMHAGLVKARKEGKWTHYTLNADLFKSVSDFLYKISNDKDDCICKNVLSSKTEINN